MAAILTHPAPGYSLTLPPRSGQDRILSRGTRLSSDGRDREQSWAKSWSRRAWGGPGEVKAIFNIPCYLALSFFSHSANSLPSVS